MDDNIVTTIGQLQQRLDELYESTQYDMSYVNSLELRTGLTFGSLPEFSLWVQLVEGELPFRLGVAELCNKKAILGNQTGE
jgi:hypothetical protein